MHRFGVPGGELYLCAIGAAGLERDRQLARSRSAVRRILEPTSPA
jgi:hypothetical protein